MTDTSQYTGSHKERFDESGKGKGIEGRVDRDTKAAEGYVGGYKGKDTYDKTHQSTKCKTDSFVPCCVLDLLLKFMFDIKCKQFRDNEIL